MQLKSFVSLLINSRLHDKFGTKMTEVWVTFSQILIEPFPTTIDKDLLAILTLRLLEQGVYKENN